MAKARAAARQLRTRHRRRARRWTRRMMHLESLEPRQLMATDLSATVQSVALLNDTGNSNNDKLTANLAVRGVVSGKFADHRVRIDFDHNADNLADGVK